MRLIDTDELLEHVWRDAYDSRESVAEMVKRTDLIPLNVINGEMFLGLYPNAEYHIFRSLNSVNVVTNEGAKAQIFTLDWWEAPYRHRIIKETV